MKKRLLTSVIALLFSTLAFSQYVNKIKLKEANQSNYNYVPSIAIVSSGMYYYATNKGDSIFIWNIDSTLQNRVVVKALCPKLIDYSNVGKITTFYPTLYYSMYNNFMLFYRGYCHYYDVNFNYIKSIKMPEVQYGEFNVQSYNVKRIFNYDTIIDVEIDTAYSPIHNIKFRYCIRFLTKELIVKHGNNLEQNFDIKSYKSGTYYTDYNISSTPIVSNSISMDDTCFIYSISSFNKNGRIADVYLASSNPNHQVSVGQPRPSKDEKRFIVISRYVDQTFNLCVVDRGLHYNKKIYINNNFNQDSLYGNIFNGLVMFDIIATPDNSWLLSYATVQKGKRYKLDGNDITLTWVIRKLTPEFYRDSVSPIPPKTPQFNKKTTLAIRSDISNALRNDSIHVEFKVRHKQYSIIPTEKYINNYYSFLTLPYQKSDTILLLKDSSTIVTQNLGYPIDKDTIIYNHIKVNVTENKDTTIKVNKVIKVDSLVVNDTLIDTLIIVNDTMKVDLGYIYLYNIGKSKVKVTYDNGLKFELTNVSEITITINGIEFTITNGLVIPTEEAKIELRYLNNTKYVIRKQ